MGDKNTTYLDLRVDCHARYRPLFIFDFKTIYNYNQSFLLSFDPHALVPVYFSQDSSGGWLRRYHQPAAPEDIK